MRHEGLIKRRMQDWIYMHVAVESPSDQSFFMSGFVTRMLNPTGTSSHRKYIIYTSMRKGVNTQSRVLDIEHAAFTSLIFTTTGGMGKECLNYDRRLAELIAIKKGEDYAKTISWIRARISFALLRPTLICLRGTRSTVRKLWDFCNTDIEIENIEGAIYSHFLMGHLVSFTMHS